MKNRFTALMLFALVATVGCQTRFSDKRTIELPKAGESLTLIADEIGRDWTLKVTATANHPIDVFIYLEENQEAAERMITLGKQTGASAR